MSKKTEGLSRTQLRSRSNLISAFEIVFRNKPLDRISVKDITDAAGYNRSTFYLYFRDIYDLADAYEESVLEETASVVGTVIGENISLPLEELIPLMAAAAGERIKRIYLCSLLPGFRGRFEKTVSPLFDALTGIGSDAREHDYLLSLLSSVLLHNIAYISSSDDDLQIGEIIDISRRLIAPGLSELISDHN